MKKNSIKILLWTVLIIVLLLIYFYSSWFGYKKWQYRRDTRGNKEESIERGVFVKDLVCKEFFEKEISIKKFKAYIERGYKYGYFSENTTRVLDGFNFPYQIPVDQLDISNDIYFSIDYNRSKGLIDNNNLITSHFVIYLKEPTFKDTLFVDIIYNNIDTIGIIKVFDK